MDLLASLFDKLGLLALVPLGALGLFGLSSVFGLLLLVLRPSRALRRLLPFGLRTLVTSIVLLGLVFATSELLFEPIVRALLGRVRAATGIAVTFEEGRGSLLTGKLELTGARLLRTSHPASTFDVTVEELALDLSLLGLLRNPVRVDELTLRGVRGTYHRHSSGEPLPEQGSFVIDRFRIEEAVLRVHDDTLPAPLDAVVRVDSLACDALRRDMVLFDVLFRSEASGTFNGQPFRHRSGESLGWHTSHWHLEGLPLMLLGGQGASARALGLLGAGVVDVEIDSRWAGAGTGADDETMEMAWRVRLGERALTTLGGETVGRTLDWLREQTNPQVTIPLRVPLSRFERRRTLAQTQLLDALGDGLARALRDRLPLPLPLPDVGGVLDAPLLDRLLDLGGALRLGAPAP
jgi:hypothetical protein